MLPAGERLASLREEGHRTGVGRVDMEPDALGCGDLGDLGDRIHRGRGRRPEGGHDRDRQATRGSILGDRRSQEVRTEPGVVVGRDAHERVAAEAEGHARLLDGAVSLGRGVDAQGGQLGPPAQPVPGDVEAGGLTGRRPAR